MRKMLSILLILTIMCSIAPFALATETFDYQTVLANRKGYEYDKFDKYWSYYQAMTREFADAYVILGLKVYGEDGGTNPEYTEMYVKILDKNGNTLDTVESIDFLIGDDLYSYESMLEGETSSSVVIGEKGVKLLEALEKTSTSDLTIRLNGYLTFDGIEFDDFDGTIKEFCRVYNKYNIDEFIVDTEFSDRIESLFPLKINGKEVELDDNASVA